MNMAHDPRLELLDLDAMAPPELRCQPLDAHDHDPADPRAPARSWRPTRPTASMLATSRRHTLGPGLVLVPADGSRPPLELVPGRGLRDCRPPPRQERAGSAVYAVCGFALSVFAFLGGIVALVAVNLANVAERNQVRIEQELLSQAVRRLAEVSAQLDADGPVVTGSQGQARPNPLLVVEQKLREEVDRRRLRVKDARSRYR